MSIKEQLNEYLKKHKMKVALVVILLFLDAYVFNIFISDNKLTVFNIFSLILASIGLYIYYFQTQKMQANKQQQVELQIEESIYNRFAMAINSLNAKEMATCTGAVYLLSHLANKYPEYIKETIDILITHIRSKTQLKDYQQQFTTQPSNEIQICINLLFKNNGLFAQHNNKKAEVINLGYSYLVGANFNQTFCQNVIFDYANLTQATFQSANCQNALFYFANVSQADFDSAKCQNAYFIGTNCKETSFRNAQCQGASFQAAKCEKADFNNAYCQGVNFQNSFCNLADFTDSKCQGAYFQGAQCQAANFSYTQCQGVNFKLTNLQAANFSAAQLQETLFDKTKVQGSYANKDMQNFTLKQRINKNTQLDNALFKGTISSDSIHNIQKSKFFLDDYWYGKMSEIIKKHSSLKNDYHPVKGLIKGVLKDSV